MKVIERHIYTIVMRFLTISLKGMRSSIEETMKTLSRKESEALKGHEIHRSHV
jgi:hypothetical protein